MTAQNQKMQDADLSQLQQSISGLSEIIKHLEKNPSTMREAFFIELIAAYEVMDESFKKRAIGLNSRLLNVNKTLDNLKNIDIDIQNKVLSSLDEKLQFVIRDFEKNLELISNPIQQTNKDFKSVGAAFVKLEKRIDTKLEKLIEVSEKSQKSNEKIIGLKNIIPILITTNVALIMVVCLLLFKIHTGT